MAADHEFVEYARECMRLAGLIQDQQIRDKLLDMAREWMAVAMRDTETHAPKSGPTQ
jgi:hypothetical protein